MPKHIVIIFIALIFNTACWTNKSPKPLHVLNDSTVYSKSNSDYLEISNEIQHQYIWRSGVKHRPKLYSVSIRHENDCDLNNYNLSLHFGYQLVYFGQYRHTFQVPFFIDQNAPTTIDVYLIRNNQLNIVVYHWKEVFPEYYRYGEFYEYNHVEICLKKDIPNDFFIKGTCAIKLTNKDNR